MIYTIDNQTTPIQFEPDSKVTRILQNGKNLLRCRMGEVPYDRMRGINPALLEKPMPQVRNAVRDEVTRVLAWEPRLTVLDAYASQTEQGELIITAKVDLEE